MQRLSIIFHRPSKSWQDKLIQILIPRKFRQPHLHVSFGFEHDYYTFTARGMEVLSLEDSEVQLQVWVYCADLDLFRQTAYDLREEKVTLRSLLLARLGYEENTCASLVGWIIFDKYLCYPKEVMEAVIKDGVWSI